MSLSPSITPPQPLDQASPGAAPVTAAETASETPSAAQASPPRTRALYNGDCPVCDSEMCTYSKYAQSKDLSIGFDDLTQDGLDSWGVTEDAATRLMHVEHDGQLYIGFEAIVVLWEQMPRYRLLAVISRLPVIFPLLSWIYTHIVARWIYTRHMRRKAKGLV